ncbi:hypothetical protein K440DRAFT_618534, partial [Wilcoxina mikolae CBS 423.85]
MSLESALEEERLEILKLLERPQRRSPHSSGTKSTPASPRHSYSPLARTTSPQRPVSSLIDAVAGPPPRIATPTGSGRSSPIDTGSPSNGLYRTRSDSNGAPRRLGRGGLSPTYAPNMAYDFSMFPSVSGSGVKKRTSSQPSSMLDPSLFPQRSKSPLGQPAFQHGRASSPRASVGGRMASPPPIPESHLIMTESGSMIDMDRAYAKLNDDALAASGGALAMLPERRPVVDKQGDTVRAGTGESITKDGGVRLQKDIEMDECAMMDSSDPESSDDDSNESFSDEEYRGRSGTRGGVSRSLIDLASEAGSRGNSSERETIVGVDPGGGKK